MLTIHLCKKATYIPITHLFSYKDLKIRSWVLLLTAQWGFFGGSISYCIKKFCGSLMIMHDYKSMLHHPQMLSKGWEEEEMKIPTRE